MVTTLYLVRHGATEGSETNRYNGSIDVPLSESGIAQVKKASDFIIGHLNNPASSKFLSYLRDIHESSHDIAGAGKGESTEADSGLQSSRTSRLQAVYTSDLARAIKSAEVIAEPHNLFPVQLHAFRERSFGIWEGMTFVEIQQKYPVEFEAWAGNPLEYSPLGGESTLEVRERVIPELERIIKDHPGEDIAIVAHGGINKVMLCHILGMPLENIFRIEQAYAAVSIIEFWDKYPVVKLLNANGC
jgi:broad specificity phosphatase PhoE